MTIDQPHTLRQAIRHTLSEVASDHPLHIDARETRYSDLCGWSDCFWQPPWHHRSDEDSVREDHASHVIDEQTNAIAALCGLPAED